MRIAFLSVFYPYRGGIAQFNANLYEAARAAGHEVKAFTFTCQYPKFAVNLFPFSSLRRIFVQKIQHVLDGDKMNGFTERNAEFFFKGKGKHQHADGVHAQVGDQPGRGGGGGHLVFRKIQFYEL